MKQELNLLDGYTPTNDLLNDAKQIDISKDHYKNKLSAVIEKLEDKSPSIVY